MENWESPENLRVNCRESHPWFAEDSFSIPGRWRCLTLDAGEPLPPDYYQPSFSSKHWDKVEIPQSDLRTVPQEDNAQGFLRRDRKSTRESEKAVRRIYRKRFTLPEGWLSRRVILRFADIRDAGLVWLNGKKLGMCKGTLTPVEFDITSVMQEGYNYLCVETYGCADADFLYPAGENLFTGIPGAVDLYSLPLRAITDLQVNASFGRDLSDAVAEITVSGQNADGFTARIAVMDRDKVCWYGEGILENGTAHVVIPCPGVRLWSAETPNLYKIAVILWDGVAICHTRQLSFGFRRIRIEHTALEVNARPLTVKGVTYCWEQGRDPEAEIRMIKQCCINAIRVPMPAPEKLFDLCDRYGLYVVPECMPAEKNPEWIRLYQIQARETVLALRSHPCVLMWDLACSRDAILELDRTRPFCREDLYCVTDPDLETVRKMDVLENLVTKPAGLARVLTAPSVTEASVYRDYPLLALSFGKGYGNCAAHLIAFSDIFRKSKHWCGGFFWNFRDFPDQSRKDGSVATGLVSDRGIPHACYYELQKGYQWIRCKQYTEGPIRIKNHHAFRNLNTFVSEYRITRDGVAIAEGPLNLDIAPGCRDVIPIPRPDDMFRTGIYHLTICMKEPEDSLLAGSTAAYFQWELEHGSRLYQVNPGGSIRDADGSVVLKTDRISYTVNRSTGNLDQIALDGRDLLQKPLAPAFYRVAPESGEPSSRWNDSWAKMTRKGLLPKPSIVEVDHMTRQVTVAQNVASGMTRYYRINEDGSLLVELRLRTGKSAPERIGMDTALDSSFDRYSWLGLGPWDTYADRQDYGWFGIHELPVSDQDEYAKPQEHGAKRNVLRFCLKSTEGIALELETDQPMECSVWPYSLSDLEQDDRRPSEVTLNVNSLQNGLSSVEIRPHTTYSYSFLIRPISESMEA